MSRPLKKLTSRARKRLGNHFGPLLAGAIALFCVWLCNGLWHGAGWNYIFFGMFHFALILSGNIVEPFAVSITDKLHINRSGFPYRCMQMIRTSVLVCIGELFFRAPGLKAGLAMFRKIFMDFSLASLVDGTIFELGMDKYDFIIIFISLIGIFFVSVLQERNISLREKISRKNIVIRLGVYYALILFLVIFGAYGRGYVPVDPIYAGF